MRLTITSLNVHDGGHDRWNQQAQQLRRSGTDGRPPDVVLLQEVQGWHHKGHKRLFDAADDLGLDAIPLLPRGRSPKPTAVLFNRRNLSLVRLYDEMAAELYHGCMVVAFDIGMAQPLTVVSTHLTPYGAANAAHEAEIVAIRAHAYGSLAIVGGDINHHTPHGPPAGYEDMPPWLRGTHLTHNPQRAADPNFAVAHALQAHALHDAAAHLAHTHNTPDLLDTTGRYGRIDQFWVTTGLRPALTAYRTWTADSDHRGISLDLDLTHAVLTAPGWN